MPDYINEFFKETKNELVRPHLVMNDGTTISVQASRYHYCSPREHNQEHYTKVEVWSFPLDETYFSEWGGDCENPASYVPIEKVNEYIELHGGCNQLRIINETDKQSQEKTQKP